MLLALIESNDILKTIEFVESVHHPKEEDFLFPLLASHPLLHAGGPRCVFFKGLELERRIYAGPTNLLREYYQGGGRLPEVQKDFAWLKDQNPLNIPMHEHRLGHELASAIRYLMGPSRSAVQVALLESFCWEYNSLLKLHIEKEETCLFVLAEKILIPA